MKKICPKCEAINDYENISCRKCGASFEKEQANKICPGCGKEFDLLKDECDICHEKLLVHGQRGVRIFNESKSDTEVAVWVKIVGVFLPVIGIVIAVVYAISKGDDKRIQREDIRSLILTSIFGQLVLALAIYFIVSLIFGNGMDVMRSSFGK